MPRPRPGRTAQPGDSKVPEAWIVVAERHLPDGNSTRGRRELVAAHPEFLEIPAEDLKVDVLCHRNPDGSPASTVRISRRVRSVFLRGLS